jgi:hypothetical protein
MSASRVFEWTIAKTGGRCRTTSSARCGLNTTNEREDQKLSQLHTPSLAHALSVRAKRQAKTGSIADNLRGNKHIGCDLTQYALRGAKTDETGLINP